MPRDGQEIGKPVKVTRKTRANMKTTPTVRSPASSNTPEIGPEKVRRQRAIPPATSMQRSLRVANTEIGLATVRRKRANLTPIPSAMAPASAKITVAWSEDDGEYVATHPDYPSLSWLAPTEEQAFAGLERLIESEIGSGDVSGNDGATIRAIPACTPPHVANISPASNDGTGGEGHGWVDTHVAHALATPQTHTTVAQLMQEQKRRIFTIKEQNGSVSRIEHLIVQTLGHDGTEKNRKEAFARARAFRLAVERGAEGQLTDDNQIDTALRAIAPLVIQSAAARAQWPILRKKVEKEMERLAKTLPGADYVATVKGLGWLGYAVIQAEAGEPLSEYRSVSGLWKRMGLAVLDGRRQRLVRDKEEAIRQGYNPARRAEIYTFLSDSMFRQQWNGERLNCESCGTTTKFEWKNGLPVCKECGAAGDDSEVVLAHAAGHYGEVYARRRAVTGPRILATDNFDDKDREKWTPKRCDNDARRVMSKSLLRDLYRVCRGLPPRGFSAE